MTANTSAFHGSIPEPYAEDLVARVAVPAGAHVVELACGTGIVTRRRLGALPAHARLDLLVCEFGVMFFSEERAAAAA